MTRSIEISRGHASVSRQGVATERTDTAAGRPGFSLVEIIIALLIMAVGVLAMAATTGYLSRRIQQSDLQTERAMAASTASERIRGIEYNDLDSRSPSDAWLIGEYDVFWVVENAAGGQRKDVTLITEGPGLDESGALVSAEQDTTKFSIAKSVR